jgi:hypothetical protein
MALFSLVVPKTSSAADNDQAHPPLERKEKGLERKRSGAAPCCVAVIFSHYLLETCHAPSFDLLAQ